MSLSALPASSLFFMPDVFKFPTVGKLLNKNEKINGFREVR